MSFDENNPPPQGPRLPQPKSRKRRSTEARSSETSLVRSFSLASNPLSGFAVGSDGTPIYYEITGPVVWPPAERSGSGGQPLPIILCDGIGCDGYIWKYLTPELARDRLVVHFHYRGHGRTPVPRDGRRIAVSDCADDVLDVATAAARHIQIATGASDPPSFDRFLLAGHSMGVQVCLEAFRRHRDRVAGLVLLCGSYGTPLRTFKGTRLLEDILPLLRFAVHAVPSAVSSFWRKVLPTELAFTVATLLEVNGALIRREDFLPYLNHMAQVDPRLFVDMLSAMGRHTAREILSEVDVPSLIVAGDADGFTPMALSEEMHRSIAGSEMHVVHSGSHTAPIERPEEVTEAVGRFVRQHGNAKITARPVVAAKKIRKASALPRGRRRGPRDGDT